MNIREGMRRLGLVVGVLGAGAGSVITYTQFQALLAQRDQYRIFQSLATSTVVQKEIAFLKGDTANRHLGPESLQGLTFDDPQTGSGERTGRILSMDTPPPGPWSKYGDSDKPTDRLAEHQVPKGWLEYAEATALEGSSEKGWKVDVAGVTAIHFRIGTLENVISRGSGAISTADISDIETDDGRRAYSTKPPGFHSYLFVLAFPLLGFFLPWGAIKMLTWIGVGFFQSVEQEPRQSKVKS